MLKPFVVIIATTAAVPAFVIGYGVADGSDQPTCQEPVGHRI